MEVKQLFAETIKKMKRLDFLSDFVRRKADEKSKLSDEVALLRKKNGKAAGGEFDIQIFQLNAKISEMDKSTDKCKREMKSLKGVISEGLRECYANSSDLEFLRKVEKAYKHVFGDKYSLASVNSVGGLFGETKIVGAVVTHDKKKKCAVKECVCVGERNQAGRVIAKPEIIVWDYDLNKPEGEFRTEDDSFKNTLSRRKSSELTVFVKDAVKTRTLAVSLVVAAVFSALLICANLANLFACAESFKLYAIFSVGTICLTVFSVIAVLNAHLASFADGIWLSELFIAIVSGIICIFAYTIENAVIGIFCAVSAIAFFIVRFVLREKTFSDNVNKTLAFAASGVFGALVISVFTPQNIFGTVILATVYFINVAIGVIGASIAVFFEKSEAKNYGKSAIVFALAFLLCAFLLSDEIYGAIISASVAVLLAAAYTYLRCKNEI